MRSTTRQSRDLRALTARAMEVRRRFAAHERSHLRRAWTSSEIMQGLVVDVGDLMRLVMAKSGARQVDGIDDKLAHELADCLWSVLVLARLYRVDLDAAFTRTMAEIEEKLARRRDAATTRSPRRRRSSRRPQPNRQSLSAATS